MATTTKQDYYELLGVPRKANQKEIRQAYRRLARKFHPDLNPGDKSAEEKFKQVQEAYDVLADTKKRQMYDQFGFDAERRGAAPPEEAGGDVQFDFGGFDFGGSGGTNFRDLFGQFFRGGAAERGAPESEAGSGLEYEVEISFWEAVRGTVKKLTIARLETCTTCHGTGAIGKPQVCSACHGKGQVTQTSGKMRFNIACPTCGGTGQTRTICRTCGGEGRVRGSETIEVRIPAGVQTGSRVRVPGHGNAGTHGEPPGDLYILTRVESHPYFTRRGDDLYTVVPITVTEAALGAKIEVPTLDGRALLRVPPGTSSGQNCGCARRACPRCGSPRIGAIYTSSYK